MSPSQLVGPGRPHSWEDDMPSRKAARLGVIGFVVPLAVMAAGPAAAAGGEILISQEAALAGSVTPGDAPGFPITLSQPGRYRLVGNLDASANTDGIVINADDVTVDFGGFTLSGGGKAGTGVASAHDAVEIENGGVSGFQHFGIDSRSAGKVWTISDMRVLSNGLGVSAG